MDPSIHQRTFEFALRIVRVHKALLKENTSTHRILGDQLLRSGTSIGAMVEEATSAESRADFIHKLNIAQKEARESLYWLKLISKGELLPAHQLEYIQKEAHIIISIISATVIKTKKESTIQKQTPSRA